MAKKNKVRLVKSSTYEDGFVKVPTYLFPQGEEYSKEVIDKIEVDELEKENEE